MRSLVILSLYRRHSTVSPLEPLWLSVAACGSAVCTRFWTQGLVSICRHNHLMRNLLQALAMYHG